jgi:cell surface protein SprA
VYENDDTWNGSIAYSWTPVYKSWEPFKKLIKSKSKYWDIAKKFGLNYLPQNITFNTDMKRIYYELQERDMESLENSQLPLTFSEQFLWNRDFQLRWDLTKNLHLNFQSGTHAEIEEPYAPINKDLYPDQYSAWKDSVLTSIYNFGAPLDYSQQVTASYKLPLNLIPIFDWLTTDFSYTSNYSWVRGTDLEDGTSLGNNINNNRTININGALNLQKLYDHVPFLKRQTSVSISLPIQSLPPAARKSNLRKRRPPIMIRRGMTKARLPMTNRNRNCPRTRILSRRR